MISEQEFIRRRNSNSIELLRQLNSDTLDPTKFHGFDAEAGTLGRFEIASKTQDILSAALLGFLPILLTKSGIDAIRLEDENFYPVELKSSYTDETKFVKTKNNAIYSVTQEKIINGTIDKNSTTSFKSNYNATYNIIGNLGIKYIDTYLLIIDRKKDMLIDCFMIPAESMKLYLSSRKIPPSGHLSIKLSTFEKIGRRFSDTVIPPIGLDRWKKNLLPFLPEVKIIKQESTRSNNIQIDNQQNVYIDYNSLENNLEICIR